jgi:hypothetical protein
VSTHQPCGPTLCSATHPHKSWLLSTSRLLMSIPQDFSQRDPEGFMPPVFHSCFIMSHTALQLSRYHLSQPRDPRAQNLEPFLTRSQDMIPRVDLTVLLCSRSNGYLLLAPRVLTTYNTQFLGYQSVNSRVHEISPISATCPPHMDGYDPLASSPPHDL